MAARRIFSLVAAKMPQNLLAGVSRKFHPSPNSFSSIYIRGLQSTAGATTQPIENPVKLVLETNQTSSIAQQVNSSLKASEKQDHAMIFSCKSCNVRSVKIVCRDSYDKGVVIARCDGCNDLHLLVDRLGLVGEHASIEEFLAAHGQDVEKNSVDALNLMLDEKQVKSNLIPSVKQNHAMIFSCKSCNARSVKIVCRDSYDKGVVVARCDSCNGLHLIVDRLGVVGEHASIEDFLAAHGQDVEKNSVDALNLMLDDPAAAAETAEEDKDSSGEEDSDSDSTREEDKDSAGEEDEDSSSEEDKDSAGEEDDDSSSEEDKDSAGGEDKHPAAKEDK